MAGNTRKRTNGSGAPRGGDATIDAATVRLRVDRLADSAASIVHVVDEVAEGAETQGRNLDLTLTEVNQIAASLAETAKQADLVTASADGLLSSINEMAASVEQVSANALSLSSSVAETAASAQETASSIKSTETR